MREAITQTPPAGFLAPGSSPSPAAFPSPAGDSGSLAGGSPVTVALPQRIHTAFPLGLSSRNSTRGALPIINTAIVSARTAAVNTGRNQALDTPMQSLLGSPGSQRLTRRGCVGGTTALGNVQDAPPTFRPYGASTATVFSGPWSAVIS